MGVTTVQAAELSATKLLESWWSTPERDAPLPVDPVAVARSLGIDVRFVPLPLTQSGSIEFRDSGAAVIRLNSLDYGNRQRFTCAHEIGHYIRRHEEGGVSSGFTDYRDTLAGLGTDPEEIYANQFAAAMLMPGHLVTAAFRAGQTAEVLARRFGTSTQAMNVRLKNLRLA